MFLPKLRFPLVLAVSAFAFTQAEAAITVTFSYDGINTIGVVSGSIILPPVTFFDDQANSGPTFIGNSLWVHVTGTPSYDIYFGGSSPNLISIARADQWSGTKSFGFTGDALYSAFDASPGGIYAPTGTFTWNNKTLEQVRVIAYTTPTLVHSTSNGQEILFTTIVPEPGVAGLLAAGAAIGTIGIRRRAR